MTSVFLAFIIGFLYSPGALVVGDETSEHLAQYAQYAQNHHDNIDEDYHTHQHVHKHSEDGEEHEHDHEHKRGVQVEIKTLYWPNTLDIALNMLEQGVSFVENSLVSDPHPQGIFRPPRS